MAEYPSENRQDLGKSFEGRIAQSNGRLKSAKLGVTINRFGDRLYLRANLPPKPDSNRDDWHQQRISIGKPATPQGLSAAEKEARIVGGKLIEGTFSWEPYLKQKWSKPEAVGDWVERFEQEFASSMTEITWKTDYANVLSKLQRDQPLTPELMRQAILTTEPNTRTRRRCTLAFSKLAQFAGIDADFKSLQGSYSASEVQPRDIPTDAAIAEVWNSIKSPGWRWLFGMLATFGLRSHECFYLDTEPLMDGHMVVVREGKTGRRLVWACYPEWVEEFDLKTKVLPSITGTQHYHYTNKVSKWFGSNVPFHALDLRHAWAIRTLLFGLPYELAAKQMGHSVAVHERTYHRWITADVHQRAYDALMMRRDRPLPPSLLRNLR